MSELTKSVQERINQILQANSEEIQALKQRQEELDQIITQATNDMENAVLESNEKTYRQAKKKIEEATVAHEMYVKKINISLDKKELVTKYENDEVIGSLVNEHKQLSENTREKVYELIRQMDKIRNSFHAEQDEINKVLSEWNRKIYDQGKRNPFEVNRYDERLSGFMNTVCNHYFCKENEVLVGEKEVVKKDWFTEKNLIKNRR